MRAPRQPAICIICRERRAEVPDRYAYPDRRKRLCTECHADRLRQDAREVLQDYAERHPQNGER